MSNDKTTSLSMNTNRENSFIPFLSIPNDFCIYFSKEKKGIILDLNSEMFLLSKFNENKEKCSYKCFICKQILNVFEVAKIMNENTFSCVN